MQKNDTAITVKHPGGKSSWGKKCSLKVASVCLLVVCVQEDTRSSGERRRGRRRRRRQQERGGTEGKLCTHPPSQTVLEKFVRILAKNCSLFA